MKEDALFVTNASTVQIAIRDDAKAEKEQAVFAAKMIVGVVGSLTQDQAVSALKRLKTIAKTVESSRKEAKAPVLSIGKKIDTLAEEFLSDVDAEAVRLQRLLTNYELEQRRIAKEAEDKRLAEEKAAAEAEEKRQRELQKAEAEAFKASIAGDSQAKQEAEANRLRIEAEAAQAKAVPVTPPAQVVRPAGTVVRDNWTFDFVSIAELYKARPELCEIVPKRSEILARIRAGEREIPGLRIYNETKVGVRV